MVKKNKPERDELGNIKNSKLPDDFWEKDMEWRWSYVFHFQDSYGFYHPVDYNGMDISKVRSDFPRFNLVTVEIFKLPDARPWDEWINWKGKYEDYLEKFFRPVFANSPREETHPLSIEKCKLVLPVQKYNEFKSFIAEYNLAEHEDFILFLLATMESNYIKEVAPYDTPDEREKIKNFPKEVDILIRALKAEKTDFNDILDGKKNIPKLQQINFIFNPEIPTKITHPLLLNAIANGTREHFKYGTSKDWEKQLRQFPAVFNENQQPNLFRYRMCKALHNFFKEVDAFNFGKHNTKDKEVHAIGWMMNFAHIKFLDKYDEEYDIKHDRKGLKKTVRNYIERKELIYHPTHYHADQIKPDFEKLLKYFDKEFLRSGDPVYNEYNMRVVFSITDRFKVNHLFPELMHLYNCLYAYRMMVSNHLGANFNEAIVSKNNDYRSLKAMVTTLSNKGVISEMQFKLSGNSEQYGFAEKTPLEIMKQALLEYYENHKADFEIDLCESKVVLGKQPGSFSLMPTGKLNEPQNRFLPVFIKNAYKFLLVEAPPDDSRYMPSVDYYSIIGLLLLRTWYFGHQMWEEKHIIDMVKYWHSLK